jgi:hypothetical protein
MSAGQRKLLVCSVAVLHAMRCAGMVQKQQ